QWTRPRTPGTVRCDEVFNLRQTIWATMLAGTIEELADEGDARCMSRLLKSPAESEGRPAGRRAHPHRLWAARIAPRAPRGARRQGPTTGRVRSGKSMHPDLPVGWTKPARYLGPKAQCAPGDPGFVRCDSHQDAWCLHLGTFSPASGPDAPPRDHPVYEPR